MGHLLRAFAALLILLAIGSYSRADDWQDCKQGEPDRKIAACSQIISFGGAIEGQALAYGYRGSGHAAKGDHNSAIVDYTKAIDLDPKYADAYIARANPFALQGPQ